MKTLLSFLRKFIVYVVVIALIGVVVWFTFLRNRGSAQQTVVVHPTDFIQQVSVSGKVVSIEHADLGFDQSGRIAGVYAKVGDAVYAGARIANIENSTFQADVHQKEALLEKAEAQLASVQSGARTEDIVLYKQKYADASSAFILAMRNAYLQTQSAILRYADSLFTNASSVNPTIKVPTDSWDKERTIEQERILVGEKLKVWESTLSNLGASPTDEATRNAWVVSGDSSVLVSGFLDHLSTITANLVPNSSALSQADIDTDRQSVNTAAQMVSSAASAEQSAYATWTSAFQTLLSQQSGSKDQDIQAQAAQVKSAEADLASSRAQLSKTILVAPFSGIITKVDVQIGDVVSLNMSEIAMIGNGLFQIESYVPEINVAFVKAGDPAVVTLDAYGTAVPFDAAVVSVDPAETLRDGVSTYRTVLQFTTPDPRIKSGMTANILITTEKKSNVISVPQGIIATKDGQNLLKVMEGGIAVDRKVETGSASSLGQVEIVSGLQDGDVVLLQQASK